MKIHLKRDQRRKNLHLTDNPIPPKILNVSPETLRCITTHKNIIIEEVKEIKEDNWHLFN